MLLHQTFYHFGEGIVRPNRHLQRAMFKSGLNITIK